MAKFWKEKHTSNNEDWMYNIEVCGRTFSYTTIGGIRADRDNFAARRFKMPWNWRSNINEFSLIEISRRVSRYTKWVFLIACFLYFYFKRWQAYFSECYFIIRYRNQIISALDEGYEYFRKEQHNEGKGSFYFRNQ